MSTSHADRFVKAFTSIEERLRQRARVDGKLGFKHLVDRLAAVDPLIAHHELDLKEYAELRNAIVHDGTGLRLARPYAGTVHAIERLDQIIARPPTAAEALGRQTVKYISTERPIREPVELMFKHSFSQMPAYENGVLVDVLTTETIVRWMAASTTSEAPDLERPVREALKAVEDLEHFRVLPKTATTSEVVEVFREFERLGKYLDALVITESGRSDELPLHIATLFDMPKLLALA